MKNKGWLIAIMIILPVVFLSGCEEKPAVTTNNFGAVELESDIVELIHGNITAYKQDNKILRVDVEYLFKNIADRDINVIVTAEFYDKNDNLLSTGGPKEIDLPNGWVEQGLSPANIISYSGERAADIDHVKIVAVEKT